MYFHTPGSKAYPINDGLYTVYIPPMPPKEQILGYDLKLKDQYWRRLPIPKYYEDRRIEEQIIQDRQQEQVDLGEMKQVNHFDPVLERYRRQEWRRRIEGVWFMNKGKPVYITGLHYYFLQWCKLDGDVNDGYPLFYMHQLKRFYFRQMCMEDPFCLGYIIVGGRGFGKSTEEVAAMLENMTKPGHNRNAAIQSKDFDEAKEVLLQQKMMPMFNNMPHFFKPEHSHGTDSKDKMVFKRPSTVGKRKKRMQFGPEFELNNMITCFAPQNKKLDSQTLSDIINDEIGKLNPTTDQDAYTRHAVNTRSIYRNHRKMGLIRATTTVEEMDKGGDECYDIWQESDPRLRDANGYTTSKIYRLFVSATETNTALSDKYGYIDQKESYQRIMNAREPVKHDNYKLALLIRKDPTTEEEAFLRDQNASPYDQIILSKRISQLEILQENQRPGRSYMIEWVNGKEDGDVELVPHPDGPVRLFFDPDVNWTKSRKLLNACEFELDANGKTQWKPCNNDLFRSSCDPIKFVKTDDVRASRMAAHGMMMFIPDLDGGKDPADYISQNIMWEYHARHTDPEIDYENVIKLMRLFGHGIMPEFNTGDFTKHLHSRGYRKFLIVRRQFDATVISSKSTRNSLGSDQPVHSTVEVIESYVKRTAAYIRRHGHRINSLPLLKQLAAFDPMHPLKFDLAVSFGYGILSLEADLDYTYFDNQKGDEEMAKFFNVYNISGNQSKLVNQYIHQPSGQEEDDSPVDFDNEFDMNGFLYGR